FARESGLRLKLARHHRVYQAKAETLEACMAQDRASFAAALDDLGDCDFIILDTPGTDTFLSRLGHARADTLITPLNDSFLDLDLLARIDPSGRKILGPSVYAEMVWEQRQQRAQDGRPPTDWIVMRNRLAHVNARNKRDVGRLLEELSRRIGFRLAPGFSERVIFRELFPKGLTLLDLRERGVGVSLNLSHVAAREEVRGLLDAIGVAEPRGEEHAQSDMFAPAGAE
ncbi:MAG: division plane positioning ATPase MipZ, partial [Rhodovibrionaceae bacterium]|nr:division plane positioning ATPase MipZ [Rhodovibrionaceae bacterium]